MEGTSKTRQVFLFGAATLGFYATFRTLAKHIPTYVPQLAKGRLFEAVKQLPQEATLFPALLAAGFTLRAPGESYPAHDWVFATRSSGQGALADLQPGLGGVAETARAYVAYLTNPAQFAVNNARPTNGVMLQGASPRYRLQLVQAVAKEAGAGLVRLNVQQLTLVDDYALARELQARGGKRVFYVEGTYSRADTSERLISFLSSVADWNLRHPNDPVVLFMDPVLDLQDAREGLLHLDLPVKLRFKPIMAFAKHHHPGIQLGEGEHGEYGKASKALRWRDAERLCERAAFRASLKGRTAVNTNDWNVSDCLQRVTPRGKDDERARADDPLETGARAGANPGKLRDYSGDFAKWLSVLRRQSDRYLDADGNETGETNESKRAKLIKELRIAERVNTWDEAYRLARCLVAKYPDAVHYSLKRSVLREPALLHEVIRELKDKSAVVTVEKGFNDGSTREFKDRLKKELKHNKNQQIVFFIEG